MKLAVEKTSGLSGSIAIPSSKSHTIRALAFALLSSEKSVIHNPLESADTLSALFAAQALGLKVSKRGNKWECTGVGKDINSVDSIDLGNSGTSLRIFSSIAALGPGTTRLDGDESLRSRPMQPLLDALESLGGAAKSVKGNGCAPLKVGGPLRGEEVTVSGKTSQYLTSLLMVAPLLSDDTVITVTDLHEKPYVEMTLGWLDELNIAYSHKHLTTFSVSGGQSYPGFSKTIPADWSSAAFPLCAALVTGSSLTFSGLDPDDSQGDKRIISFLQQMGADIRWVDGSLAVTPSSLKGVEMDLNDTPDLLPVMAVLGCFASGETRLINVAQARIKETDRISVMCSELRKLGAQIEEREDGLVVRKSSLVGTSVDGHLDHRAIMALGCAGLGASGITSIKNADALDVTFPLFVSKMNALGCSFRIEE